MEVWCGMIMGFDNDDAAIFDRQIEFIQQSADLVLDERDALRDSQDAAARPAGRRRPARPGRPVRIRHERHPAADEPRGAARRLPPRAQRALRARGLLRADRRPVPEARSFEIGITKKRSWWRISPSLADLGGKCRRREPRPLRPPDDQRPRARAPARVPQAALELPQGPSPARACCSSTCSTWSCTTTPGKWPRTCPAGSRSSSTRSERAGAPRRPRRSSRAKCCPCDDCALAGLERPNLRPLRREPANCPIPAICPFSDGVPLPPTIDCWLELPPRNLPSRGLPSRLSSKHRKTIREARGTAFAVP